MSLAGFGTAVAREAVASDPQLARRFGLVELPAWEADGDFADLVATAIRNMPLEERSVLSEADLRAIIAATHGNTARAFQMIADLAVRADR